MSAKLKAIQIILTFINYNSSYFILISSNFSTILSMNSNLVDAQMSENFFEEGYDKENCIPNIQAKV